MSTITRALVLAETGTPTEALSLVDGLLPDLRDCELAEVLADALRTRATALVALRRPNDASEAVAEAIALYEQSGAYACVEPSLGELAAIEGLA